MEITLGELFADLQVSMTEVELINLLPDGEYTERLEGNLKIIETIKGLIRKYHSDNEIRKFLDSGYPRAVNV